ncbi:MAG: hypothetical protein ACI9W4_001190 [Rhodothermales bacterium]|jgi:hypothetical protein
MSERFSGFAPFCTTDPARSTGGNANEAAQKVDLVNWSDFADLRIPFSAPAVRFLFLLVLLLCAGCRDFAVDALSDDPSGRRFRSFDVEAQVPFEMNLGDEAFLQVADMTITFSLVLEDSRCPSEASCNGPGKAGVLMDIAHGIGDDSQIILNIPGQVPTPYRVNDYVQHRDERFQLLELTPYPKQDDVPNAASYTATILIDR